MCQDDLTEGKGAEFVDNSSMVLVFFSAGYSSSVNCMRELLRAAVTGKPLVIMLESEVKHGGLSETEVRNQLTEASTPYTKGDCTYTSMYQMWGLDTEVTSWGFETPLPNVLSAMLFARSPAPGGTSPH